ncbi:MAG TPA: PfkB family carbohydrate kinase [Prosthecobacter sp.]
MQHSAASVVGIGAATLDDLWLVPQFSGQEGVVQALQHVQMGGGPVATALCVLSVLGRHPVALCDVVGDDESGRLIRFGLERHGVDTAALQMVRNVRSASAVVMVRQDDGARQITFLPATCGDLSLDETQRRLISGARLLHLNGRHESAAREAVSLARTTGATISFDGGAGRYRDSLRDLVEASHVRIVSRDFARAYAGVDKNDDLPALLAALQRAPAQCVVITDGVKGSHVWVPGEPVFHQPAFPAAVVDTTGCGDVYHGAFLHGWLEGWPAVKCARFASQAAACNAEGLGGRWACVHGDCHALASLLPG